MLITRFGFLFTYLFDSSFHTSLYTVQSVVANRKSFAVAFIINAVVDAEPEGFVNGLGLHLGSGWLLFVGIITEFDFRFNL